MKVTVKYFASFREAAGTEEEVLELPEGITISKLLGYIIRMHPEMEKYREQIILSRNKRYANESEEISDNDEIAVFPPVSGG